MNIWQRFFIRSWILNKKNRNVGIILIVLLLLVILASMMFGSVKLSMDRIIAAFMGKDRNAEVILFRLRLPRLAAALLAGAGLATAGFILQTVTDNGLCAPNIIGVNSGAGFFVMLIMCFFPKLWRLQPISAFIGALTATFIVLAIGQRSRGYGSKSTIILAGVAISSLLSAGISFLSLKFPDVLSSYMAFSVGGFSGVTLSQLAVPALIIALCFCISMLIAPKLGMLCMGDDAAANFGVNVPKIRITAIVLSSALCAAVVSFAGLLGFVGLVVPHMVRRLVDGSLRLRLPYTVLCGGILTALSDLAGRTLFTPGELPAGLIMAFIGAPFFIYLLLRRAGHNLV